MEDSVTYYLYEGEECIGSVRAESGSTDNEVRSLAAKAVRSAPSNPHKYETRKAFRNRLRRSKVKTFFEV